MVGLIGLKMLEFIELFWREGLLVALSIIILFFYKELDIKKRDIAIKDIEIQSARDALEMQNASIIAQKTDYEAKLKQLPKVITKIQTKYQVIYKDIDKWRDSNVSKDCNNSIQYLDNFVF